MYFKLKLQKYENENCNYTEYYQCIGIGNQLCGH